MLATSNNEDAETRTNFYLPSVIKSWHINTHPLKKKRKKKRAFKTIVFIFFFFLFWFFLFFFFFYFFNSRHHKCARNLQTKGPNTAAYVLPNPHGWHWAVRHLASKRYSSAHPAQSQPSMLTITSLLTGSVNSTCRLLSTPAQIVHSPVEPGCQYSVRVIALWPTSGSHEGRLLLLLPSSFISSSPTHSFAFPHAAPAF